VCFENYKLLKSLLKDLTAKLTTINENQLNKSLNILLSILFDLIKKQKETQLNAQKSLIDILSSFWELFSKQLVSTSK
jgi:hypothetical protein